MKSTLALADIARRQDAKIQRYLDGTGPVQFWYANCPMEGTAQDPMRRLHDLGFDNYPVARIPSADALYPHLFFFERVLGADIEGLGGAKGDFFHTWCRPLMDCCHDAYSLKVELKASEVWLAYETAIADYIRETSPDERLPVAFPAVNLLDAACNLCGAESFFVLLYEDSDAAEHVLDTIVTLIVEAHQRVEALGARVVSSYGFPGIYCNDLQQASLSPSHITGFLLPRYERLAQKCGGLLMALHSPDLAVLKSAMNIDGVIGCLFDKTLPLAAIKEHLGNKLFVINNYCYDDALDRPTLRDGIWWNPIVQSYSRELEEVHRELTHQHSLLITIERPTLAHILDVRDLLLEHPRP